MRLAGVGVPILEVKYFWFKVQLWFNYGSAMVQLRFNYCMFNFPFLIQFLHPLQCSGWWWRRSWKALGSSCTRPGDAVDTSWRQRGVRPRSGRMGGTSTVRQKEPEAMMSTWTLCRYHHRFSLILGEYGIDFQFFLLEYFRLVGGPARPQTP